MSEYYNAQRIRNLYQPGDSQPYKLSRSKIDLFLSCPRCFYIDRRLGVGRPPGFPFNLNSAVDSLLKNEFDFYREQSLQHPLLERYRVDARPVVHENLDQWRNNFEGIQYLHVATNFLVYGAIDDLWENNKGEYVVVDYKATSKNDPITELNDTWHIGYKQQMEIYQWLLRNNNLKVSDIGYFVYCNGLASKKSFDGKLEFDITLIPYQGNAGWVENSIVEAHKCLNSDHIPNSASDCDYCAYIEAIQSALTS